MKSLQTVKPSDCVIGFGIPNSREQFNDKSNTIKDFAQRYNGIWPRYENQVVRPIEQMLKSLDRVGLRMERNLTFNKFTNIFSEDVKVLILFSHWKGSTIEFQDRMVDVNEIIDAIPNDYTGIIDLCVCHPNLLVEALRKQKPNNVIKYIDRTSTPTYWLVFYQALFVYLSNHPITYMEGINDVLDEFRKQIHENRKVI